MSDAPRPDLQPTDVDLYLLGEGTHERAYQTLGAHPGEVDGERGVAFSVVAPNAQRVAVVGDFNGWNERRHPLLPIGAGVWSTFVPGVELGAHYKFRIWSSSVEDVLEKADPYAFSAERRPGSASRVWDLHRYEWAHATWMGDRALRQHSGAPISIYEVHLGSWRRTPDGHWLSYRRLAEELTAYLLAEGFTHVELMPIAEHPLDASWGYQVTGYFAPTSRFGTPDDFRYLIDTLHQAGIGVVLDWVPGHFPDDPHGLATFDGSHLYEHADPREGRHPEWHTQIFNLGRWEVRNFLLSNARFWLDQYHVDGLRVDAVASMLYRDYAREDGAWVPNADGGRENHEAVAFLRDLNQLVAREFPDVMTIAEESTSWPGVSRPTADGGLGFRYKWNMGWMNDTLSFLSRDPVHRAYHASEITFSLFYAFSEHFVLPLSHDEVVHGKGALASRLGGDDRRRLANARLLLGYLFGHPGKKLLFMGCELGQFREWDHDGSIDWDLTTRPAHAGVQTWVRDLNRLYRDDPRMYALDGESGGFMWVDHSDHAAGVFSFLRSDASGQVPLLFVLNFADKTYDRYCVGAPAGGRWAERLNSDAVCYGGSGRGNLGEVVARDEPYHGQGYSLELTVPSLSVMVFEATAESM